jgi:hypothetical protein
MSSFCNVAVVCCRSASSEGLRFDHLTLFCLHQVELIGVDTKPVLPYFPVILIYAVIHLNDRNGAWTPLLLIPRGLLAASVSGALSRLPAPLLFVWRDPTACLALFTAVVLRNWHFADVLSR